MGAVALKNTKEFPLAARHGAETDMERAGASASVHMDGLALRRGGLPEAAEWRRSISSLDLSERRPSRAHTLFRSALRTLGLVTLLTLGLILSGRLVSLPSSGSSPRPFPGNWNLPWSWFPGGGRSGDESDDKGSSDVPGSPSPSRQAYRPLFTPPTAFPVEAFSSMHRPPAGTTVQPRPAIPNLVTSDAGFFPDHVAHPSVFPTGDKSEHGVLPIASSPFRLPPSYATKNIPAEPSRGMTEEQFVRSIRRQLDRLILASSEPMCERCLDGLKLGQRLAHKYPARVPGLLAELCITYQSQGMIGPGKPHQDLEQAREACQRTYATSTLGGTYAQILSYAQFGKSREKNLQIGAWTSNAWTDVSDDGRAICARFFQKACPAPQHRNFTQEWLDQWFAQSGTSSQVPSNVQKREKARKQRHALRVARGQQELVHVAHLSDIHLDPRYMPLTEGACTTGQCCRVGSANTTLLAHHSERLNSSTSDSESVTGGRTVIEPAGYYGAYKCDSPWSLMVASLRSIRAILPAQRMLNMSLFTGDAVTHENAAPWQLTRDLLFYTQQAVADALERWLGPGPVYSSLGNHDSVPSDFVPVSSLPDGRREAIQWEWDNVARLLRQKGWVTRYHEQEQVRRHQGGYSVLHAPSDPRSDQPGLRIVVLNTDAWYRANPFAYVGSSDPDGSGMLRFLTEVLARAELKGEKVWLVGHVLPAWSGANSLENPTLLLHAIMDRFAPHTLVGAFFGHTHEDQFSVVYPFTVSGSEAPDHSRSHSHRHAGLLRSTAFQAKLAMLMAPSITPGSNVNPAFRVYEVDAHTWEVHDYKQYFAQLASVSYNSTAREEGTQPPLVWELLYSAREEFGHFHRSVQAGTYTGPVGLSRVGSGNGSLSTWPSQVPLNGSFWAAVTDEMRARPELVSRHTQLSGRLSPRSPVCLSDECRDAKICYMRAGDAVEGQSCPQGFDSVQSGPDTYH